MSGGVDQWPFRGGRGRVLVPGGGCGVAGAGGSPLYQQATCFQATLIVSNSYLLI